MSDLITVTTREWKYAESCVKTVEKLKKRLKECETNSNKISMKDDWVEYKFQMRLVPELKKLMGEKQ